MSSFFTENREKYIAFLWLDTKYTFVCRKKRWIIVDNNNLFDAGNSIFGLKKLLKWRGVCIKIIRSIFYGELCQNEGFSF